MPRFATQALATFLPPVNPTPPAIYSVPEPSGGYTYWQAPAGTSPALNNDWPLPNVAHPNDIGVSSLHMGRPLPPGSVKIGSGHMARGSVTAMPGAGGEITGLEALGAKGGYKGLGDYQALDSRPFGRWPLRGYGDDGDLVVQPDDWFIMDLSDPTVQKTAALMSLFALAGLYLMFRSHDEPAGQPSSGRGWT